MNQLFSCCTAHDAVIYWEKAADTVPGGQYEIFLNEKECLKTSQTFAALDSLDPDTEYRVFILYQGQLFGQSIIHTERARRPLDVTASPFFACSTGDVLCTDALQAAIDACGPDEELYFPAGTYLTGALTLHSNLWIYLDEGALLQGTAETADYLPRIPSRFEGTELLCYQSLLNLGTLDHTAPPTTENVLLYGKGTISGGGAPLAQKIIKEERQNLQTFLEENSQLVAACENENTIPGRVRGRLIQMCNCRNVRISGLTLQNGASWNVHMIYCDNIITDHCTFRSQGIWNGDGWDPDSSSNCTLFGCRFFTEDDSVAIKSGKNPEGNAINRPSAHIRIFGCTSAFGHGICIGSEISGGIRDVRIWDCDIASSSNGLEIKGTPKRGGYVEDVSVEDCTFPRVLIHSVSYNDDGIAAPHPPLFRNFRFNRLRLTGRYLDHQGWHSSDPIEVAGFQEKDYPVRDISFRKCTCPSESVLRISWCSGFQMEEMEFSPVTFP